MVRRCRGICVVAVLVPAFGLLAPAADLLTQSDKAEAVLRAALYERILQCAAAGVIDLSRPVLFKPGAGSDDVTAIDVMGPIGLFRLASVAGDSGRSGRHRDALHSISGRTEVLGQIGREPKGVGTYVTLNDSLTQLVRRDLGWTSLDWAAPWRVVVTRDRVLERTDSSPLSGRWIGAFSLSGVLYEPGRGMIAAPKEAGTISAILLEDGGQCLGRLNFGDATYSGLGTAGNAALTLSGILPAETVWIFHGLYEAARDEIRGDLHIARPDAAFRRSVFLKRAGAAD
jgi:hypothetical protein